MWIRRIFLIFFVLTLSLSFVSADILGVSPAMYNVDFEPGVERKFKFNFLTGDDTFLEISVSESYEDYVKISTNKIEKSGDVIVTVNFPEGILKPGKNGIGVTGRQVARGDVKGFGIMGSITAPINIRVPFPGKYVETHFVVESVNEGGEVPYSLRIDNFGTESVSIKGDIKVLQDGGVVLVEDLGELNMLSKESRTLEGVLKTSELVPSLYDAIATLEYGGDEPAISESSFRIGTLLIEVTNYTKFFEKNKINRFEITVRSFWKGDIQNVFARVDILNIQDKTFSTPSISVSGFGEGHLTGFFDTTGIEGEDFKARILVYYENKTASKIVDLKLVEKTNYIFYIVVFLIGIFLIVIITMAYLLLRRRDKRRRKK